jgi:excisionase family DNA binding protein
VDFVPVEEAAHHLGVSVATVRRRLSSGKLAGKKVGRDWQVEAAALPPASSMKVGGGTSEFTDAELLQAIQYVSGTDVTEMWIPDILRWADILSDPKAIVARVRERLSTGVPGQAFGVRIPKNALASRAGTLIDLVDCVIYQAAVTRVATGIGAATSPRVLSARLSEEPRYFLRRSAVQYVAWQNATLDQLKKRNGLLLSTDLSSYFDTIDQPTLLGEIGELTGEIYAVDLMRRLFRSWSVLQHRGIPQGPNASRLLGNAYLLPVDDHMIGLGYDYWRYMDDVSIIVSDHAEAARAVAAFEMACRSRGLLVSSAKTTVQTQAEARSDTGSSTAKKSAEYLMKSGSVHARKALMAIFNSSVPISGKIDVGDAKFSVWRLAQTLDRGPLGRLLGRISDLGPIASVSAAYLRHFISLPRVIKAVGDFLSDPERNTSEYLESWLFAAALEFPGKIPETWAARARTVAIDRNCATYHRVLALNALALQFKASDIAFMRRLATHEHDPEIVRGALVALARISKLGEFK